MELYIIRAARSPVPGVFGAVWRIPNRALSSLFRLRFAVPISGGGDLCMLLVPYDTVEQAIDERQMM